MAVLERESKSEEDVVVAAVTAAAEAWVCGEVRCRERRSLVVSVCGVSLRRSKVIGSSIVEAADEVVDGLSSPSRSSTSLSSSVSDTSSSWTWLNPSSLELICLMSSRFSNRSTCVACLRDCTLMSRLECSRRSRSVRAYSRF